MAESEKEMEGKGIEESPGSPLQGVSEGSAAGKVCLDFLGSSCL